MTYKPDQPITSVMAAHCRCHTVSMEVRTAASHGSFVTSNQPRVCGAAATSQVLRCNHAVCLPFGVLLYDECM